MSGVDSAFGTLRSRKLKGYPMNASSKSSSFSASLGKSDTGVTLANSRLEISGGSFDAAWVPAS